jgi:hypothetical protein
LLSEFSLVTGDMPQLRHAIRTLTNMPAVPLDPPEILMPPEGSGLANQNYWVNDRAGSKAQGAADTAGNYHFYEWFWGNPNLGLGFFVPPFVHANAGYRIVGQGAGKHLEGGALNRGWNRHGWETDIMGTPFKLSYWDWFCLKFGAVPNEIRVVGRLVLDQTPIRPPPDNNRSYSLTSAALGWKQGTSDEEIARAVMPFDVTDFDEIAGIDETDAVSEVVDVDEDFSDVLKATYPSDGALCFGMNIQFQVVEVPNGAVQIFAGCRFDGGAISVGGRLEAVFDGQRVILAEV